MQSILAARCVPSICHVPRVRSLSSLARFPGSGLSAHLSGSQVQVSQLTCQVPRLRSLSAGLSASAPPSFAQCNQPVTSHCFPCATPMAPKKVTGKRKAEDDAAALEEAEPSIIPAKRPAADATAADLDAPGEALRAPTSAPTLPVADSTAWPLRLLPASAGWTGWSASVPALVPKFCQSLAGPRSTDLTVALAFSLLRLALARPGRAALASSTPCL